jgi:thioredoxin-related protein
MKKIVLSIAIGLLGWSCGHSKKALKEKVETNTQQTETTVNETSDEAEAPVDVVIDNTKINWLDFETAIQKNKIRKKLIFIDIYTDWCGWCKKMDATTFKNHEVIKYMNTHFYAVKMDAQSKDPIPYKGKLYEWKNYGRAGYNTLAVSLLDSQMSFPSFVVLSKKETKLGKIIGYRDAKGMLVELEKYIGKH